MVKGLNELNLGLFVFEFYFECCSSQKLDVMLKYTGFEKPCKSAGVSFSSLILLTLMSPVYSVDYPDQRKAVSLLPLLGDCS